MTRLGPWLGILTIVVVGGAFWYYAYVALSALVAAALAVAR